MKTFHGGIHPNEYKELTETLPIERCPDPAIAYVALSQHFGKPAKAIVKVGDSVQEGDLIAEADGFISAPIHSPITGKIKRITKHPHVLGVLMDTIIIEGDAAAPKKEWPRNALKETEVSKALLLQKVKEKGIVGLGGAGFPTVVKLMGKEGVNLDTILINACECEPYVNVDNRAILEQSARFIEGLSLLARVMNVTQIVIGIEDNKPEAQALLKKSLKSHGIIKLIKVKTKYPQGGEKMLIKAALNREVPRGGLPLDVGVVVLNVNTVIAIANAVYFDKPILEKLVTVSGYGIMTPKNVSVKVGTPFSELIAFCGGMKPEVTRLIVGGPMMGFALSDDQAAVLKTTTGLLALTPKEIGATEIQNCIRCGECVSHCPMNLMPTELAKHADFKRLEAFDSLGLMDCMECGSCVFVCPAHRPLVQSIKVGKVLKREADAKKKGS